MEMGRGADYGRETRVKDYVRIFVNDVMQQLEFSMPVKTVCANWTTLLDVRSMP